jgi:hypothetical protein
MRSVASADTPSSGFSASVSGSRGSNTYTEPYCRRCSIVRVTRSPEGSKTIALPGHVALSVGTAMPSVLPAPGDPTPRTVSWPSWMKSRPPFGSWPSTIPSVARVRGARHKSALVAQCWLPYRPLVRLRFAHNAVQTRNMTNATRPSNINRVRNAANAARAHGFSFAARAKYGPP